MYARIKREIDRQTKRKRERESERERKREEEEEKDVIMGEGAGWGMVVVCVCCVLWGVRGRAKLQHNQKKTEKLKTEKEAEFIFCQTVHIYSARNHMKKKKLKSTHFFVFQVDKKNER